MICLELFVQCCDCICSLKSAEASVSDERENLMWLTLIKRNRGIYRVVITISKDMGRREQLAIVKTTTMGLLGGRSTKIWTWYSTGSCDCGKTNDIFVDLANSLANIVTSPRDPMRCLKVCSGETGSESFSWQDRVSYHNGNANN